MDFQLPELLALCGSLRTRVGKQFESSATVADTLEDSLAFVLNDCTQPCVREMVKHVAYAVLNYSPLPLTSHAMARTFVAVGREPLFKVPAVQNRIRQERKEQIRFRLIPDCDVKADAGPKQTEIAGVWARRWEEYASLTDGHAGTGPFTWNQYLMSCAENPRPIGITWGSKGSSEKIADCSDSYTYIDDETLRAIGLPPTTAAEWQTALWNSTITYGPAAALDKPAINRIAIALNAMAPTTEQSPAEAAWAVYQLVRSYSCWGGNAFLSIPVAFGYGNNVHTSVLALCTEEPVCDDDILRWILVARECFQPLVSKETASELAFVEMSRALGHSLKNRLISTRRKVRNTLEDNDSVPAELARRSIDHLLSVFQIFSLAASSARTGSAEREVWSVEQFDIVGATNRVLAQIYSERSDQKVPMLRLHMHVNMNGVIIQPWYRSGSKEPVRLCDILYDEIFLELFINAAEYGEEQKDGMRDLSIQFDSENSELILANPATETPDTHRGLAYCSWLLQSLGAGSMTADRELDGEFIVRLRLTGLTKGGEDGERRSSSGSTG